MKHNIILALYVLIVGVMLFATPAHAAPTFSIADVTVNESAGSATITIRKNAKAKSYSIVQLATADGAAIAGSDYQQTVTNVTFGNNELVKTVAVPIINDTVAENTETFTVNLAPVRFAFVSAPTATVTIIDDDVSVSPDAKPLPPGLSGAPPIADNFDTSLALEPFPLPAVSGDDVGAFRMLCNAGKVIKDDPVVYPGQPGVSHLHVVWGNLGMDANSTYQSLRTTGSTSCGDPNAPVNRTAYWMPAMLDGTGNVVLPDLIQNYYKQIPAGTAECRRRATACLPLPNGIKYVYGWNPVTMSGGINDPNSMDYWALKFQCWKDYQGNLAAPGSYHTLPDTIAAGCPSGAKLIIIFAGPGCWNGQIDAPDHRSHLSYGTPESGGQICPTDHPYLIAAWQGWLAYTTDDNFTAGKWRFSSDDMMPGAPAGTTLHFDYEEGWSPTVKATWQQYCIDAHKTCSSGDLGNGTRIKGAESPLYPPHRLVPVP